VPLSPPAFTSPARLSLRHASSYRYSVVTMQQNLWDKDETSRFREMLTRAVRTNKQSTNKGKVKKIVIAQKETESAEESEVQEYVTWYTKYTKMIFPEVARIALFDNLKSVPSLLFATQSSAGSSATVGGCMRNNVANYQNMTPEEKKKIYENALFVSNLATVTLGMVILALLVGDALKIYHEFRLYYPDLQFQKELLQYHADLSMSKL